jgi:hypothetical protein
MRSGLKYDSEFRAVKQRKYSPEFYRFSREERRRILDCMQQYIEATNKHRLPEPEARVQAGKMLKVMEVLYSRALETSGYMYVCASVVVSLGTSAVIPSFQERIRKALADGRCRAS